MIDKPGLELDVDFSVQSTIDGRVSDAIRERTRSILNRVLEFLEILPDEKLSVDFAHASEPHVGLGTGTQLAMAIAVGAARLVGRRLETVEAVQATGRGKRSGIGVHGFFHGGFIVDGGRSSSSAVAPMVARHDFPEDWKVVLVEPAIPAGLSGELEQRAFDQGVEIPEETTDRLSRLLLLSAMPALAEEDFPSFAQSMDEYNRRVGECFAPAQGGAYAHPRITEIVSKLHRLGVQGVGQSSWGPTIYALAPDEDRADWIANQCQSELTDARRIQITTANNFGARIDEDFDV